ncbi:hypothetical protein BPUTEOMOX_886 [methanotrophic endosymbiont of Bathymodiolus puteoserpentis (Logatchev)]|nr:hypothetical protein BAZMOX_08831_1 [methanotrophic endosymbiont of Bathymodiolus azoricus (Menez Gwen)]SHE23426.1 hypothetical protein BPUTEOMOX_886 [methanotrophic endosymbiont of Bathymodiolus puteoserpentis (Logatchev)]
MFGSFYYYSYDFFMLLVRLPYWLKRHIKKSNTTYFALC